MVTNDSDDSVKEWSGDLLGRKALADYLTRSLASHSHKAKHAGMTVALDGDWGTGKTFFVRKWIDDLRAVNHPVIYFDAWSNDIGDEASTALMSSVLTEFRLWEERLPKAQQLAKKAKNLRIESVKKLRRALIPVSGVILKGLAKKALGVGIEEISEAAGIAKAPSDTNGDADAVLDKLFELSLVEHSARQQAIVEFRLKLDDLLKLMLDKAGAVAPMFIFVDELDRCRPSYAIKLLEEIKHIFGIPGVVYVISTNIDQLQNSVRAIYGAEFDGRRYLSRLFDREYTLPNGDEAGFSDALLKNSIVFKDRKIYSALPQGTYSNPEATAWLLVSRGFNLDLRTQKQVFSLAEEVANVIPHDRSIHLMWLFFLCACHMRDRKVLKSIEESQGSVGKFGEFLAALRFNGPSINYSARSREFYESSTQRKSISVNNILSKYFELSGKSASEIFKMEVENIYDYPNNILNEIQNEFGGTFHARSPKRTTVSQYAELILRAGQLLGDMG